MMQALALRRPMMYLASDPAGSLLAFKLYGGEGACERDIEHQSLIVIGAAAGIHEDARNARAAATSEAARTKGCATQAAIPA